MKQFIYDHAGETITVPAFNTLAAGVLRKARKGTDDIDKTFIILEVALGEDSPELAKLDAMNLEELAGFIKAWTQGAGLGEA